MSDIILSCKNLDKTYEDAGDALQVLSNVNFDVHAGDSVAIIGSSGSGKSTFLQLLGGLDRPTAGTVSIAGKDINTLNERQKGYWRNQNLGFIYQFHHLLPEFDALENVCMPMLIGKASIKSAKIRATEMLERVGLGERLKHRVSELSGGERQRVAIARAIVNKPKCVLADEPTGNLDDKGADNVCELLLELNRDLKTSLIIVTHNLF